MVTEPSVAQVVAPLEKTAPAKLILQRLHEAGYLTAAIGKRVGQRPFSMTQLIATANELGYHFPGIAFSWAANSAALIALNHFARKEHDASIRRFSSQFSLGSFAMTEGAAGTDLRSITTTAQRDGSGYILNGKKNTIANAATATHAVVFARVQGADPKKAITAFHVELPTSGFIPSAPVPMLGLSGCDVSDIHLNDVAIPATQLLGEVGQGLEILGYAIQRSKTLMASIALGIARRALDLTKTHVTNRTIYGATLSKKDVIRDLIADLHTETEASWLVCLEAARLMDEEKPAETFAAMAKYKGTVVANRVVSECVELFGASGVMNGSEISTLYEDVRAFSIVEGASFVQKVLIARQLLP